MFEYASPPWRFSSYFVCHYVVQPLRPAICFSSERHSPLRPGVSVGGCLGWLSARGGFVCLLCACDMECGPCFSFFTLLFNSVLTPRCAAWVGGGPQGIVVGVPSAAVFFGENGGVGGGGGGAVWDVAAQKAKNEFPNFVALIVLCSRKHQLKPHLNFSLQLESEAAFLSFPKNTPTAYTH